MQPLTKRQREILDYLNEFIQQFGYAHQHLYIGGRWGDATLFEKILNDRPPSAG